MDEEVSAKIYVGQKAVSKHLTIKLYNKFKLQTKTLDQLKKINIEIAKRH